MRAQAASIAADFKADIMGEILFARTQEGGRLFHARPDGKYSTVSFRV